MDLDRADVSVGPDRCDDGRHPHSVPGSPGGGATLAEHGVIAGGDLPAQKARQTLALALTAVDDTSALETYFPPDDRR